MVSVTVPTLSSLCPPLALLLVNVHSWIWTSLLISSHRCSFFAHHFIFFCCSHIQYVFFPITMGLSVFQRLSVMHYEFFEMKAMRLTGPWFSLSLFGAGLYRIFSFIQVEESITVLLWWSYLRESPMLTLVLIPFPILIPSVQMAGQR